MIRNKDKRVLVTGGAGFVGSHLCERLLEQGHAVICLDDFCTGSAANIAHLTRNPHFQVKRHDVTESFFCEADEIYNLACPASPVHYQADPIRTFKTSVLGALNTLALARGTGAKTLLASTSEVYGDPEVHPQRESYWGHVNPTGTRACYDEGKRSAETLYFDYHRCHRVGIKVARIFNTYGPRMHPNDGRVVSNFIVQALTGQPITIYGDGTQTRSFCYVDDLVDGFIRLMASENDFVGPVNLGNPCECTMQELAELVLKLTGSRSALIYKPLPSDDPKRRRPDISLARRALEWSPSIPLERGVARTIEYFDRALRRDGERVPREDERMMRVANKPAQARAAVLVTGGAGYIGSHTCKALARAGYLPVTFDNLVHGHRWAVRWGPLIEADLANEDRLRAAIRDFSIRSVIHLAGYAYVGESVSDPLKYFQNNLANTLTLLEVMHRTAAKNIVFSSTCATYGAPAHSPIDEETPQLPMNPYGESKLMVERILHWWSAAHGMRWTALRYFNAAGADPEGEIGEDHRPETHLIPLAIQTALGVRDGLEIYGCDYPTSDGTAIRDYIHVADLASAHLAALRRLEAGGESLAINLGTGAGHSVREVVSAVERVSGRKVPTRAAPRRAGDPPALVSAVDRARILLNWHCKYSSLDTIIETAWRWHSARHAEVAAGQPVIKIPAKVAFPERADVLVSQTHDLHAEFLSSSRATDAGQRAGPRRA
jgi:UDP-glucuronate decarboxylase